MKGVTIVIISIVPNNAVDLDMNEQELKKALRSRDRAFQYMTDNGHFRVAVLNNTKAVETARVRHGLSPLNTVLLGRVMSGASLLAMFLKGEERIVVEAMGNGPAEYVYAEAVQVGEIRGFVKNPSADLDYSKEDVKLSDGLGIGVLRVSRIQYEKEDPVTGTVELLRSDISTDLAHYLRQSEQIASAVVLDTAIAEDGSVEASGGLIVQAMPGASDEELEEMVNALSESNKVSELLINNFLPNEIAKMVIPVGLKEVKSRQVDFFCRCSLDRFKSKLMTFDKKDIQDMQAQGQNELVCHYCNEVYTLSTADFDDVINKRKK